MIDSDEIFAACIIEYARRQPNKILSGPFYVIGKDARDSFNLPYVKEIFQDAIAILEDLEILSKYSRPGMQTFYRVDAGRFDGAMRVVALDVRQYLMTRGTHDGRVYGFLEAFHDLGPAYLVEALETYEAEIDALADVADTNSEAETNYPIIDSSSWTGLPRDFSLEPERLGRLVRELDNAELALAQLPVSQETRAQARAYIVAARTLAEAPEPAYDAIWDLVGRANSLAGIASLFVSIISLFAAALH